MIKILTACFLLASVLAAPTNASAEPKKPKKDESAAVKDNRVQLGPRPFYLVEDMDEGPLKDKLLSCSTGPFQRSDFSIGHRGAAMQFPEHTKESFQAAAVMGAGIIECDVAVTRDGEFVCRHDQCDLKTTTNILADPALAPRCLSGDCCTSDFDLAELKTLCGEMDGIVPPTWRTDLYATCGTIMSHKESIELIRDLGGKFTPELKEVKHIPAGMTNNSIRQQLIDEYKAAGVNPDSVWPQSFFLADVLYWIENEPAFGQQAVFLDSRVDTPAGYEAAKTLASMDALYNQGVRIVAPPTFALLTVENGEIVPSEYAKNAKLAGLDIITWTLERSGRLSDLAPSSYYYQSFSSVIDNEGDMMKVIDVLAQEVGVLGIFADWPGTVTYYANCMGLK